MKTKCFAGTKDRGLAEVPEDTARSVFGDGCVWFDVEDFGDDELTEWLKSLDFSPRATREVVGLKGRTRVVSIEQEALFELPALASDIGSERVPLAFLCRPNLCVTVHRAPVEGLARTANQLTGEAAVHAGASTSSLVAALLAGLSGRAVDATDELRRHVMDMQDQLDRDPDQVNVADIQELSSWIRALDAVIGERLVVLDRLRLLESPALDLTGSRDLQAAESDAQYLDRLLERLEKRVANVREQAALYQQGRTNKRLAVLTVLSAVFLPLTLIAGIYGMNFEVMPELGYRYAYPLAIGLMVVLGIGMIAYFRSRGWFD
jgi:magnesium transporter